MFAPSAGYDRAITIFSPDGRLYQVEYALETVRRGSLAVGLVTKEGVVLAVEEKGRKLQSGDSVVKMFQIDDHVGAVGAGYIPDARIQVDNARVIAQSNRPVYDEPVDVESVAKRIADLESKNKRLRQRLKFIKENVHIPFGEDLESYIRSKNRRIRRLRHHGK